MMPWTIRDLGSERALLVEGREYRTYYSERVLRMLIGRKGYRRAPLYLPFKETRGRFLLDRLFAYLAGQGVSGLAVLEVGCSFGHITEYLCEQPLVGSIETFDPDEAFVAITRAKVEDLVLAKVHAVHHLAGDTSTRLPFPDGRFDVVLVVGVIEHLPVPGRHRYVNEYYRVLAPGGHVAILDTPNRAFPLETHTIGLPGIQWLPSRAAYQYARLARPHRMRGVTFDEFQASAWRNASFHDCLPAQGREGLVDVTEAAGYGWRFFRDTSRSRIRTAMLPLARLVTLMLARAGLPLSMGLPYFNVVFRKERGGARYTGERTAEALS